GAVDRLRALPGDDGVGGACAVPYAPRSIGRRFVGGVDRRVRDGGEAHIGAFLALSAEQINGGRVVGGDEDRGAVLVRFGDDAVRVLHRHRPRRAGDLVRGERRDRNIGDGISRRNGRT